MVTFSAEKELSHHIIRIIFNLTGGCSRTIPSYRCVWISPVPICLGRLIHTHLMHTHGAYTRLHRLKPPGYSMSHTRADGSVGVPLCVPLGAYTRRIYAPSPASLQGVPLIIPMRMAAWTCPFACPLVHTRGAYTRLHRCPPRYSISHTRADG